MIGKNTIDIDKIYSAVIEVAKTQGARFALIFGSFARGDYSKRSDLDVIFVEETRKRFIDRIGRYLDTLRDKESLKPFDIDVLVYTPEEFEKMKKDGNRFILWALREGKVLYEHREGQKNSIEVV
ncbi:MAG: nucleotidyltransferase domain-containing protein [Nitrospirota bacterium]